MHRAKSITSLSVINIALSMLMIFSFIAINSNSANAKKKKPAKYGTIKVQTTPPGLPVEIDGKPTGVTATTNQDFDLPPGLHTIVVTMPGGQRWTREIDLPAGRIKCLALNYRPAPVIAAVPCPYPVVISAPTAVSEGELVTFTADASYGGSSPLNYRWSVSPTPVKPITGEGTRTITVDSTGLAGQRVVATLVVEDGSGEPLCRQMAQVATVIPARARHNEAHEFDVCGTCAFDDQKARLDNLGVELQNDPTTTAYVIAYAGRNSRAGQAGFLGNRARDYLVIHRGIDQSRIVVVNGGFREEDTVELWIVPRGATPPQATPTVQAGDVNLVTPGKRQRSGRH